MNSESMRAFIWIREIVAWLISPMYQKWDLSTRENGKNYKRNPLCGCWDSSPGLYGHNVEFLPLNYSHFCLFSVKTLYKSKKNSFLETTNSYAFNTTSTSMVYPTNDENFSFFSSKFRVSGVGETKNGGKMSMEEISVNFTKFRRNFGKKRNIGNFFKKKIASNWKILEKFPFVLVYFGNFSPIFLKNWHLTPSVDPTAPSFPIDLN